MQRQAWAVRSTSACVPILSEEVRAGFQIPGQEDVLMLLNKGGHFATGEEP
jgi:hypothetical protein